MSVKDFALYVEDILDGFDASDKEWRQAVLAENGVTNSADLFKELLATYIELNANETA
jgi:hypothetical protein